MREKIYSIYLSKCFFLLICFNAFSQKEIYKKDFVFDQNFKSEELSGSLTILGEDVVLSTSDHKLYSLRKDDGKINWQIFAGNKLNSSLYDYENTFFHSGIENDIAYSSQYNLKTGDKIQKLSIESINSKPHFLNNVIYCTALADGGKLMAYNLEENKVIWSKNIGFGVEKQPIFLKDKIIANAEDDNWFEIDYNGNFLKSKSKKHTYLDTTKISIKNYKFLTHDGKEITQEFLKKNKLFHYDYQTRTSNTNTFILTENQLLVLGNNRKTVLQLNLEKEFAADNFDPYLYTAILATTPESVWFCCQNKLIHYDYKNKKNLRKVDLTKWNPYRIVFENRTIWLISKNDGQLYALDFEPDQKTAYEIEAKAKQNICTEPDPKMIEAAKAAQEKNKNK